MKVAGVAKEINNEKYNLFSEDFIPISSHYDKYTLLTKNGELVQVFQIKGINSDNISKNLSNLREAVRTAIKNNTTNSKDLSFWIHTIREKANLDDNANYEGYFSANVHDLWKRKNFWHDKFVNSLYISVVHDSSDIKVRNYSTLVNSLNHDTIVTFEENFKNKAAKDLTKTVDDIINSLSEYGANKLQVYDQDGVYYSELASFYRRLVHLYDTQCKLSIGDISESIASNKYIVGTDMMEIVSENHKKFASVLSVKEYSEVYPEALDKFLQTPVEMVVTEIFYFIEKNKILPSFSQQDYILSVSGDSDLRSLKGLDKIIDSDGSNQSNNFCIQQISFMIVGDDLKILKERITQASLVLSKIGVVHVQEDVNVEKAFWSQLPGNFSYIHRTTPTIINNTSAFASLHNFPTGNQYNPWGRALTLLRTEKSTPYFANFHDAEGKSFCAVFGPKVSGRTTLMNFLLSESDKYKPTILHFVDDLDSAIYVKARAGIWYQRSKNIINPFLVEDTAENRSYLLEFFKIISNHYFDPLEPSQMKILRLLVEEVMRLPHKERILSKIVKLIDDIDPSNIELSEEDEIESDIGLRVLNNINQEKFNIADISASTEDFDDNIELLIDEENAVAASVKQSINPEGNYQSKPDNNLPVDPSSANFAQEKNYGESDDIVNITSNDLPEKPMDIHNKVQSFKSEIYDQNNSDKSKIRGVELKKRLEIFLEDGEYSQVFERPSQIDFKEGSYVAISLHAYDNKEYRKNKEPKDKKFMDQFEYEFNTMRSVKLGIVYAATRLFKNIDKDSPKILAIDNLAQILSLGYHENFIKLFRDEMQNSNGVFFITASMNALQKLYISGIRMPWIDSIATKYVIPPEIKIKGLDKILSMEKIEIEKLNSLNPSSRAFLIIQDKRAIASELSIGGLPGLVSILSANSLARNLYIQIVKESGAENLELWLSKLYQELDRI